MDLERKRTERRSLLTKLAAFIRRLWALQLQRGLVLLCIPLVWVVLPGCANLRSIQVFNVEIVNDSGMPVVVKDCYKDCSSFPVVINLASGGSSVVHAATGQSKYMWVLNSAGSELGCLSLNFANPEPNEVLRVSGAGACPGFG